MPALGVSFTLQHGIAGLPAVSVASARRIRHYSFPIQSETLTAFITNVTQCSAAGSLPHKAAAIGFEPKWDNAPENDWALQGCLGFLGLFLLLLAVVPQFRAWYTRKSGTPGWADSDRRGLWP